MIQNSGLTDVNVFCLNSSFEIKTLIEAAIEGIDILVAPIFCYETIVQHMPMLKTHLRYVWFHQIDEMCRINEDVTYNAIDQLLLDDFDIQVNWNILNTCSWASFRILIFEIHSFFRVCLDCDIIKNILSNFARTLRSCKNSNDFYWIERWNTI